MSRVFAYCRVSTTDQTTQNQSIEITAAGFAIQAQRLIEESISGSVAAKERPGFTKLAIFAQRLAKQADDPVLRNLSAWPTVLI